MNSNWTKDLDTFNSDLPAITLYDIEPERFEIKDRYIQWRKYEQQYRIYMV